MRTLLLMRHAKSDWSTPGVSDHDRPLNPRGCRAAPRMAEFLALQAIHVDVILVSSARRAQQTIEIMRQRWAEAAILWTVPSLYLATPEEIAKQVHSLHDSWQRAMVVGHNPGLSQLASQLSGEDVEFPTAAVAMFSSPADSWNGSLAKAGWQMDALWKPRDLEA